MAALNRFRLLLLAGAFGFIAHDARAQTDLVDLIGDTYFENKFDLLGGIGNVGSFEFPESFGVFDVSAVMNSALVLETAAFPIGSSSGGFTYVFDATTGAPLRNSPSFGPAFAERPLTGGKGKMTFGMTYSHRSFDKIEGQSLTGNTVKFYAPLNYITDGTTADVIESTLNMTVKSDTATIFMTYGVLEKLDVAVAFPIQHVSLDVGLASQLIRFGPNSGIPGSAIPAASASRSGSASGLGDIAIRGKYNFYNAPHAALAAGVDVRVPTGDEANLLGTGRTRTRLYAAFGSSGTGTGSTAKLFPHANFGYTFESKTNDNDYFYFGSEVSYAAGAEYVAHPKVTVIGDIFGRSLANEGRVQQTSTTFQLVQTTVSPQRDLPVTLLQYEPGLRLNSTLASIGAKFNPWSTFIVSAHALFQLTDAGISSSVTPVIGFDYSF